MPALLGRDLLITEIEKPLKLLAGERPVLRVALELGEMPREVLAIEHLPRAHPELLLTDLHPGIPCVAQVVQKHLQVALVVPDRRTGKAVSSDINDELLDRQRRPLPRPFAQMADRATDQIGALLDRPPLQMPTRLLNPPTVQDRVEHELGHPERPRCAEHTRQRPLGPLGRARTWWPRLSHLMRDPCIFCSVAAACMAPLPHP